jgi:hypothetical protein
MFVTASSPIACEPVTMLLVSCAETLAAGMRRMDAIDAKRARGVIGKISPDEIQGTAYLVRSL